GGGRGEPPSTGGASHRIPPPIIRYHKICQRCFFSLLDERGGPQEEEESFRGGAVPAQLGHRLQDGQDSLDGTSPTRSLRFTSCRCFAGLRLLRRTAYSPSSKCFFPGG
ncbi:unnamed protein product, partial [Musa hybrid cultivar]